MPRALKVLEEVFLQSPGIKDEIRKTNHCIDVLKVRGEDRQPGCQPALPLGTLERRLSSNPGALSNHYFPLTVDDRGVVRLDFSKGAQTKPRRGSA